MRPNHGILNLLRIYGKKDNIYLLPVGFNSIKQEIQTSMALEEEIRILRQDVEYIKVVLAELVDDSVLTSDEEVMVRKAREAVQRGDLSDFINAEEL